MPATIGPNAQQQAFTLAGGYFVYTNASTATLTVSGFDGYCHVEVGNAVSRRVVSFSVNKTMNLAVAGPGGLQQDHIEAISTVYVIYLAWKSATNHINGTADLFAVPSGTNITPAKLTTLGAGYDYCSRPIGFVTNSAAGNILNFQHTGEWFKLTDTDAAASPLVSGKATVSTAIPLAAFVPLEARRINFRWVNQDGFDSGFIYHNVTLYQVVNGITKTAQYQWVGDVESASAYLSMMIILQITNALNTMIYYKWNIAPTVGSTLIISGIQLSSTDRERP